MMQQVTEVPVVLGPFGAAVAGLLVMALQIATGYIAYRATKRAKTAEAWQSTANANASAAAAAKSEMEVHRGRADRLDRKALELVEENARLQAATDLSLLSSANQEEHKAIVTTLSRMADEQEGRYEKAMDSIAENTKALLAFQSHMAGVFEMQSQNFRSISDALARLFEKVGTGKKVTGRLSQQA